MPVTNDELLRGAYNLSGAIIAMYRADGFDPDRIGEPNWAGTAADAFSTQLSRIKKCTAVQHEFTLLAAQAIGMMFAVTTQFRESCRDLMDKTAQTCDSVIAGSGNPGHEWMETGIGLVKTVIDAVKNANPGALAGWALEQFLSEAGKAATNTPVPGDAAGPVVEGYVTARERLFSAYEDNLDQIREWVTARRNELAGLTDTIPEPLPSSTDVDSPDFRYEHLYHPGRVPADYAPEVERERQKYVEEKTRPDGVITERLAGER